MFCCLDMRKYQLLFWKRQNQRRLHPDQTNYTENRQVANSFYD